MEYDFGRANELMRSLFPGEPKDIKDVVNDPYARQGEVLASIYEDPWFFDETAFGETAPIPDLERNLEQEPRPLAFGESVEPEEMEDDFTIENMLMDTPIVPAMEPISTPIPDYGLNQTDFNQVSDLMKTPTGQAAVLGALSKQVTQQPGGGYTVGLSPGIISQWLGPNQKPTDIPQDIIDSMPDAFDADQEARKQYGLPYTRGHWALGGDYAWNRLSEEQKQKEKESGNWKSGGMFSPTVGYGHLYP